MPHQPGRPAGRLVAALMACLTLAGLLAVTQQWRGPRTAPVSAGTTGRYVSRVTDVQPSSPGLRVRLTPDGAAMTVQNDTGHLVVVRSYSGEAYLRITADGVQENVRSLSSLLNRADGGATDVAPTAVAMAAAQTAPPLWRTVSAESEATWPDQRTRWGGLEPPPAVRQRPDRSQPILDWSVQLEVAGRAVRVRGVLSWIGSADAATASGGASDRAPGRAPGQASDQAAGRSGAGDRSPEVTGDDGWR